MSEALSACPFCGEQSAFVERADFTACFVQCDCNARGPIAVQESDDEDVPGENAAIAAWNRRAPTSAAGATNPNELTSSPEPAPARASGLLPVAREGLSDEQIMLISEHHDTGRASGDYSFARAIEAAHGIAPASGDAPGEAK